MTSLDEHHLRTLRAAANRIIPADDYPAAWDVGVGTYIARLLNDPGAPADLPSILGGGLEGIDAEAHARHGRAFDALSAVEQDALLSGIERGIVTAGWTVPPIRFFRTLADLVAEGYYGDPGNGGNRDEIAWRMIGYLPRMPRAGAGAGAGEACRDDV